MILVFIGFIPVITEKGVAADQSTVVISEVLQKPVIYQYPALFPVAKGILLILFIAPVIWKNKFRKYYLYMIIGLTAIIAVFQNISLETRFGYSVLTGNIIIQIIVVLSFVYELKVNQLDFSKLHMRWWNIVLLFIAFFAFYMPHKDGKMYFSFSDIILNEACVTYCMITPVILSCLLMYYPSVNQVTLRVMSFAGLYFGILNMITWFVLNTDFWWMGILHLPLMIISLVAFLLSFMVKTRT